MKLRNLLLLGASIALAFSAYAAKPGLVLDNVQCQTPPPSHCPDANCEGAMVIQGGTAIEPKSGREFWLDYPCGMKKGDKVTFILSLHGFGSYGNWMRHYFPLMDFKDKYHLVIATPNASNAPPKAWQPVDDAYLQNIVDLVYDQVGKENIKAFWLVGHSQGGLTSNRLLRTDFFKQRVDGWLSLSGGRLGGNPGRGSFTNLAAPPTAGRGATSTASSNSASKAAPAAPRAGAPNPLATPRGDPDVDVSFIYETGQHEMNGKGIPETSTWAEKLGCKARVRKSDIADSKAGYVYDSTRQNPGSDAWGRLPRPGTAELFVYPGCRDGRLVADVVRESKGHTEGLEPHVTEDLIKLMLSAKPNKH